MYFEEWIKPELLILIPVLYIIGIGVKKSKIPDKRIPLLLGAVSVVLSASWIVATTNIPTWRDAAYVLFASVTQSILSAGASVYCNQLYVQSKKNE